jgi:hypothetical protein
MFPYGPIGVPRSYMSKFLELKLNKPGMKRHTVERDRQILDLRSVSPDKGNQGTWPPVTRLIGTPRIPRNRCQHNWPLR